MKPKEKPPAAFVEYLRERRKFWEDLTPEEFGITASERRAIVNMYTAQIEGAQ